MGWLDPSRYVTALYIERSCADDAYGWEIAERAGLDAQVIEESELQDIIGGIYPTNLGAGKQTLLLSRNRGDFLKDCPATREYRCCDYRVLNVGTGCPMDCVYCILQAYLNSPNQTFYVNTKDLTAEVARKLAAPGAGFQRIGTGEFTDSMALDRITRLSDILVPFFARQQNAVLELKTKSGYVDNLRDLDHNGRVVISWSLNSDRMVQSQEIRAASIEQRLEAAKKCSDWGYHLAFHFDPIISYRGWEEGYLKTIRQLFGSVAAASIRWISLGGFRYLPGLKKIGTERFPHSQIFHHEFIEGLDGKQRYFRPHRVQMYKKIYSELQKYAHPETCIYFCMESDEIWQEVMGFTPEQRGGVSAMLDRTVAT